MLSGPGMLLAGLAVSHDSSLLVSLSVDKTVKVYDVHTYDMIAMLRLPFAPACAEWIYKVKSLYYNVQAQPLA